MIPKTQHTNYILTVVILFSALSITVLSACATHPIVKLLLSSFENSQTPQEAIKKYNRLPKNKALVFAGDLSVPGAWVATTHCYRPTIYDAIDGALKKCEVGRIERGIHGECQIYAKNNQVVSKSIYDSIYNIAETRQPDLSGLTYDEKLSIEMACIGAKAKGPAAYNSCLRRQLAELGEPIQKIEIKKPKPKRIIKKPSKPSEHVSPKDIRKVQSLLSELGYDAGPIDGTLGKKTRKAIIEFQRDVGVPITGKVDKNLLSHLETAFQIAKTPKKTKPPVQISKQSPRTYSKVPSLAKVLPAMPSKINKQSLTAADLFRKVQLSIYVVVASSSISAFQRGDNLSQGSAVAVSQKCLLTNCHVLENRPYVLIIQGEEV